jgi:hypothetical protein
MNSNSRTASSHAVEAHGHSSLAVSVKLAPRSGLPAPYRDAVNAAKVEAKKRGVSEIYVGS